MWPTVAEAAVGIFARDGNSAWNGADIWPSACANAPSRSPARAPLARSTFQRPARTREGYGPNDGHIQASGVGADEAFKRSGTKEGATSGGASKPVASPSPLPSFSRSRWLSLCLSPCGSARLGSEPSGSNASERISSGQRGEQQQAHQFVCSNFDSAQTGNLRNLHSSPLHATTAPNQTRAK